MQLASGNLNIEILLGWWAGMDCQPSKAGKGGTLTVGGGIAVR